mgnify:FL=1
MTNPVFDRIKNDIDTNDVVLYMKGDRMFPQCGFSATVIEILNYFKMLYYNGRL